MMQAEDRFLSLGVLSFVIMVHLALIVGIRFLPAPELPLEPPGLSFVDLGLMDGGQSSGGETQPAAEAEPAPAPKPPPAQVKPQPQPQPRTAPRPEQPIKPVIRRDDRPADVAVRQEPLRNEPEAPATPTRPPATEPAQSDHRSATVLRPPNPPSRPAHPAVRVATVRQVAKGRAKGAVTTRSASKAKAMVATAIVAVANLWHRRTPAAT